MYGAVAGRMLRSTKHISNRQRQKLEQEAIEKGMKIQFTLLSVLAQLGGEIIISKGTLQQVGQNSHNLGFSIEPKGDELVIRMVEKGANDGPFLSNEDMRAEIAQAVAEG